MADSLRAVQAPSAPSGLQVLSSEGGTIVYVRGELDVYSATLLRRTLAELIAGGARDVVLDLRDLSFMSATGLGVLIGAARRLRHHGGTLVLRSTRPSVRTLIEITGWEEVLADPESTGGRLSPVYTVGHGTLAAEALAAVLGAAAVDVLVDVRSYPGSRRNPQFGREAMEQWAPTAGLIYVWMPALGGRRRPLPSSRHIALREPAFRAYADHMETADFLTGVDALLALADTHAVAIMCSESVWWRCHRRLLADHLLLVRSVAVVHLMHDGRHTPHAPTAGARLHNTSVVYDVGADRPLPG